MDIVPKNRQFKKFKNSTRIPDISWILFLEKKFQSAAHIVERNYNIIIKDDVESDAGRVGTLQVAGKNYYEL